MQEEWRPVVGFEQWYSVSNVGRIKRNSTGRIKKAFYVTNGYPAVSIRGKTITVHKLVALAFHGPRPYKNDINHIDGNKSNNWASNLEYLTRKAHFAHGLAMGLNTVRGNAILREEDIPTIRLLRATMTLQSLADKYGVSDTTISRVVSGENWAHIA